MISRAMASVAGLSLALAPAWASAAIPSLFGFGGASGDRFRFNMISATKGNLGSGGNIANDSVSFAASGAAPAPVPVPAAAWLLLSGLGLLCAGSLLERPARPGTRIARGYGSPA